MTVALRGAKRPKLREKDGKPKHHHYNKQHWDRAAQTAQDEPARLHDIATNPECFGLQPALGVVFWRELQDQRLNRFGCGAAAPGGSNLARWERSSGQIASSLEATVRRSSSRASFVSGSVVGQHMIEQ